jgi:hypothetical protein
MPFGFLARLRGDRLARHHQQAILHRIDTLAAKVDALTLDVASVRATQKQLGQVLRNQAGDEKWRVIFRKQLQSLVRAQYLNTDVPAPLALQASRFRLRSQNEEDGVILALLRAAGISTRRFVEIGSGGSGGNSAVLAYEMGWSGLMVDASRQAVKVARREFRWNQGVTVVGATVTPDNVNSLLQEHGMAGEVDLLSLDIDSIDYWVLDALDVCRPRVLVTEYNAFFGGTRAVTVPNAPMPAPVPWCYWGASLAALTKAAQRRGYGLVLCEDAGVNAFFLREDLAPDVPRVTPPVAHRPVKYRRALETPLDTPEEVFAVIANAGLALVEV